MDDLKRHELFEMETLQSMGAAGFLRRLVFGGGTMLRLCHELPRYSVDLDFWFFRKAETGDFSEKWLKFLKSRYEIVDFKNKRFTLLSEIRSRAFGRRLKIEIRKEAVVKGVEERVAFSKHGSVQVLVRCLTLDASARGKATAALGRTEIRDFFDLEFLIRRGADPRMTDRERKGVLDKLSRFGKADYASALGTFLPAELRRFCVEDRFSHLRQFCSQGGGTLKQRSGDPI